MTTDSTLIVIVPFGMPPYSARGLTQTLDPINQSQQLRRTVNGELVDISAVQFQKYTSIISCSDMDAPGLDGVWPGQLVDIDCAIELSFLTGGAPAKNVVPGSTREADGFTFYRPRLTMRVMSYSNSKDEWGAEHQWQLTLEEV